MNTIMKTARFAGAIYVFMAIAAPVRYVYIPNKLFVEGNTAATAAATAANLATHESLFRIGILTDLLTGILGIFLVLALYQLFKGVNQNQAVLMVILGGLMVTPIYFLNVLNDVAAVVLVSGANFLSVFDQSQLDALVSLFLQLHHHGILVNQIFWGLWLFPFGALVIKSGFFPRILGVLLIINGLAYLTISFSGLLLPHYEEMLSRMLFPALLGEMLTMLWLLIMGAKVKAVKMQTVNATAS